MIMNCKNPYIGSAGRAFGCGQCLPCRINKRRIWMHRIMLEASQYKDNAFVTLTYSDENLPEGGNLSPLDFQLWLKRLRRNYEGRLRFFGVGEYGDYSERAHYHAALFNYPTCRFGMSRYNEGKRNCCSTCDYVRDTWGKGNVLVGSLQRQSASYIAGYVTKKMTAAGDIRLNGRVPEFARMSLRPGIGGDAMHEVADVVLRYDLASKVGDVPNSLRHGACELPLGRYLVQRVRVLSGVGKDAPKVVLDKIDAEMLPLRLDARADNENPSIKKRVIEKNAGKVQRVEALERIYHARKVI